MIARLWVCVRRMSAPEAQLVTDVVEVAAAAAARRKPRVKRGEHVLSSEDRRRSATFDDPHRSSRRSELIKVQYIPTTREVPTHLIS